MIVITCSERKQTTWFFFYIQFIPSNSFGMPVKPEISNPGKVARCVQGPVLVPVSGGGGGVQIR